jgi:predicted helicase
MQNVSYPHLDERIRSTYAEHSKATNKNALYDSYIRAIRWASDRVGTSGVMGFVTNAGFIEANTGDGLRKCLADEFSCIYVFHLRGNGRTSGELRRKEKDNVFGQGTRTPIAITIFVKNPDATKHGKIYFHDIGDYLSREQKLQKINQLHSISGISAANAWHTIKSDAHHDWLNKRDDSFSEFMSLGDKKDKDAVVIFENYSSGVKTNRDAWCYNFSQSKLAQNMQSMIDFYNQEVSRYELACKDLTKDNYPNVDNFINTDTTQISWNRGLKNDFGRFVTHTYQDDALVTGLYRPFTKSPVYFSKYMNDMVYQMPRIFPDSSVKNLVILLKQRWSKQGDFALIVNCIPDLQPDGGAQCFPLYLYEANTTPTQTNPQGGLFDEPTAPTTTDYTRRDAITDAGLKHFTDYYQEQSITKEDLFYYIYGLLHSEEYKSKYADNLTKELPRIPRVKQLADFWAFSQAGRDLAELHINYETVKPYPVTFDGGKLSIDMLSPEDFRVTQMKFAKKGDKTIVIYNPKITMKDIPVEAYDYVVNGKPALEWVMERQAVTTHKDSGIVNDANDWAIETMGNARYPLELFQRVITVSLETMKIVNGLPKLEIE